jgi:hypothetical protein
VPLVSNAMVVGIYGEAVQGYAPLHKNNIDAQAG